MVGCRFDSVMAAPIDQNFFVNIVNNFFNSYREPTSARDGVATAMHAYRTIGLVIDARAATSPAELDRPTKGNQRFE
jgi:hypothetical protein